MLQSEGLFSPSQRNYEECREFCSRCGGQLVEPKSQHEFDKLVDFFLETSGINYENDADKMAGFLVGATRQDDGQ